MIIKRLRCRHDNLRGIYGDEIMQRNWKRSMCINCRKTFDDLPPATNKLNMQALGLARIEKLEAELVNSFIVTSTTIGSLPIAMVPTTSTLAPRCTIGWAND